MALAEQNKKIHPYKFTLWVAMGSIVMMFAGFTSAYIVKRNQANWQGFDLPPVFYYSTAVIIISSLTMIIALRKFKERQMGVYRKMMLLTALLGTLFMVLQWIGFQTLQNNGIKLIGVGSNVSGSFLAVIAGVHMAHVLGGVVALLIMVRKAFSQSSRSYSRVGAEVAATYWHFVDILWIYLFIFLTMVS
ncbi:MAG: cytochrome c oxidase subunit 3 [Chitinophagaceae bacterium]|jgi:cytochrome c oxidase subunit 3|nr:cytochrome c oxidase subunit 3 [Chitinophagaceae bacterium]